ncbi:hypothetical protein D9M73_199890 [compost metagenome]
MPYRVAQEVIQLVQTQGFSVLIRRQARLALLVCLTLLVQHLPFMGIAEQWAALLEVPRAERLQRVLLGQCVQQLLARFRGLALLRVGQMPARSDVIAQLADQHRGRAFAIVADTAPDPADIQLVTC